MITRRGDEEGGGIEYSCIGLILENEDCIGAFWVAFDQFLGSI
jgi:hypothetical protein